MKYAIIENDVVINTVLSDPELAEENGWIAIDEAVGIGCSYVNGEFVDNRWQSETAE